MKICMQTQNMVGRVGAKQAYRMFREAGFEAIDWSLDQSWNSSVVCSSKELKGLCIFEKDLDEIMAYYAEELACIQENGLKISQAHAPTPAYTRGRYDLLEYAIGIYRKMIRFCQAVGCERLVIHGISVSPRGTITEDECNVLNWHLYESLIPELSQSKVVVCIENLYLMFNSWHNQDIYAGMFSNPYKAAAFIDELNAKAGKRCFGICLDTGHLHLTRQRFCEYVPIVGDRIRALHIHDNMQNYDSHLMPYAGSIRWQDFLTMLKSVGYDGDLSFQTFAQVEARNTPVELVPSFLRAMARVGNYFRTQLQNA